MTDPEDELLAARRRIILLEAVVREGAVHIARLLTETAGARWGAKAWVRELPERTGLRGLHPGDSK
jgi:hypothetical protein